MSERIDPEHVPPPVRGPLQGLEDLSNSVAEHPSVPGVRARPDDRSARGRGDCRFGDLAAMVARQQSTEAGRRRLTRAGQAPA